MDLDLKPILARSRQLKRLFDRVSKGPWKKEYSEHSGRPYALDLFGARVLGFMGMSTNRAQMEANADFILALERELAPILMDVELMAEYIRNLEKALALDV